MIKKSIGIALLSTTLIVMGCSSDDDSTPAADAGSTDTGTTDTGTTDTGTTDTGTTDTGTTDTGTTDTGTTDAGGGDSGYPAGSLADVVFNDGRASDALAALKTAGLDLSLNDDKNAWTVFLPTNEALAAFTGEVSLLTHIYDVAAVDSTQATGLSGNSIAMNDGTSVDIAGGGTEALTIGGHAVVGADLTGNTSTTIVHIIDGVLTP